MDKIFPERSAKKKGRFALNSELRVFLGKQCEVMQILFFFVSTLSAGQFELLCDKELREVLIETSALLIRVCIIHAKTNMFWFDTTRRHFVRVLGFSVHYKSERDHKPRAQFLF